jgi:Protein of unknown function DUF262
MSARDPKPEILRLEELALQVKAGDIKLPRFQRPFVWKRPDMLKLLDSIYKGYPIGSLLLWNSSQRLKSERSIAGLEVDDERTLFPTNYLLDGQQRLTTLCGALFWKSGLEDSIWNIHFDLESETFVHPKNWDSTGLFPLNRLIGTSDFIRQCMRFEHHPKKDVYVDRAERLLRSIKDYKVAVVKIGDMSLEEVAPIFERINSTGRKLTMVDLMMAATWSNEFDLAEEISKVRRECQEGGFGDIPDPVVLRSIAASANLGINKEDIQRLRGLNSSALREATDRCRRALLSACAFFREQTPADDFGLLPYGLQLTHFAEIFRICPAPDSSQRHEMASWFWMTSATQYFRGAGTGQNSQDLARTREFARGTRSRLTENSDADVSELLFGKFNLRNASSTTFTLLLLSRHPKNSLLGKTIPEETLLARTASDFIAFGPTAIRGINLSRVINPDRAKAIVRPADGVNLTEHLLSQECISAALTEDTEEFIQARSKLIADQVSILGSCVATYRVPLNLGAPDHDDDYEYDVDDAELT